MVNGHRLLFIRNPWGRYQWKGKWSNFDTINWLKSNRSVLNYNPQAYIDNDVGCFWMEWEDVLNCFTRMYAYSIHRHP